MNTKLKKHFGSKPIIWVPAWGISKLRKRGGKFAGAIPGDALWFDDWYARVMSPENAAKLAGLGVNLVVLPFSVGGNAHTEKSERDDFERMAGHLHAHGIVTLPYLQYQNILQETPSFPNPTWAVQLDGSRKQFAYWRRTACQSSPGFLAYFKELIADAIGRGADGIWIDNTYLYPCRCELCARKFKDWLAANRRDLLAELYFSDFEQVEIPPGADNTHDPVVQALNEFNCRRNLDILRECKEHLAVLKPDALFASNPGVWRGNRNFERGLDLRAYLQLHDLVYLENKFFPNADAGQLTGNFHGFIAGAAAGAIGIPGAWKRHDFDATHPTGNTGLPESAPEIRRVIFEAAACGGAPGMFWAVRARPEHMCAQPEDLRTMYYEHPAIYKAMQDALDFVRALPVFGETANLANIAVLHHRASLALNSETAWTAVHAAEEFLHAGGMPYNVLFSEDFAAQAGNYKVIVLPGTALLSAADAVALANYVRGGGRLLALGDCGLYDEKFRERPDFILKDILGVTRFNRPAEIVFTRYGAGQCACLPLAGETPERIANVMQAGKVLCFPAWHTARNQIRGALLRLLGADRQIRLKDSPGAAVTLRRTAAGAAAAHFLAYAPRKEAAALEVEIHPAVAGAGQSFWHTPAGGRQPVIAGAGADGYRKYVLPEFLDYGVLLTDARNT